MVARAHELLRAAFGAAWPDHAELCRNPPLTHGRGAAVFTRTNAFPGRAYPPCTQLGSQTVRYDGRITGCCNESVIMGLGPARLARRVRSKAEVGAAIDGFHADPLLRVIGGTGPGALTAHPRLADLADRRFTSICDLCWTMLDRVADDEQPDPLIEAVSAVLTT